MLIGAGAALADDSAESPLPGSVSQTVEVVPVDELHEEAADVAVPVAEEADQQVAEPVVAPVEVVTETAVAPVTALADPVVDVVEPVVHTVNPVTEPVTAPVVETVSAPVVETVSAPVVETVSAPLVETVSAPVVETVEEVVEAAEPLTSSVTEPLTPVTGPVKSVLDLTEDVDVVDVAVEEIGVLPDDNVSAPDDIATPALDTPARNDDVVRIPAAASDAPVEVSAVLEHAEAVDVVPVASPAPAVGTDGADVQTLRPLPQSEDAEADSIPAPTGTASAHTTQPSHPPGASPAQAGTCLPTGAGNTARSAVDGLAGDMAWLSDVRARAPADGADNSAPRAPYRDIPTSPA